MEALGLLLRNVKATGCREVEELGYLVTRVLYNRANVYNALSILLVKHILTYLRYLNLIAQLDTIQIERIFNLLEVVFIFKLIPAY
jgi:hypothetical protein